MRKTCFIAASAAALLAAGTAAADDWPTRPVTMVIPFAAGSGVDVLGRIIGPGLSEALGQQVIIENVGGAGGMTGAARVAKAPPDGYQFVLGNVGTHAQNQTLYKRPLYDALVDFTPVILIADQPLVLIARKDLPARDLREFVAYTKANQRKMQYASAGAGSAAHLACMLLNAAIGVDVTHVPYRGGGPAMQDLIAGQIDYQCPYLAIAISQIESNTVHGVALLSKTRSPVLPNLATAQEQALGDFDVDAWAAFFLPKGTSTAITNRLHDAAVAAVNSRAIQEQLKGVGAELVTPERRSSEYLHAFVESEIKKWAGPIKAANVSAE